MPVFAKKVETTDSRFAGRRIAVAYVGKDGVQKDETPIPDNIVLCSGCNENVYPDSGWLIYLGRRELNNDQPYDIYCEGCRKKYFPKAKVVE